MKNIESDECKVYGDLTVDGTIFLIDGQKIDTILNADIMTITTKGLMVKSATDYADADCKVMIASSTDYDSQVTFMEGALMRWSIGNDGSDDDVKLSFSTGVILGDGSNEKMSLDLNADLEVGRDVRAGRDVVAANDIAVAATSQINFDGIGGHTYIHEDSNDSLSFVVGSDTALQLEAFAGSKNSAKFGSFAVGFTQAYVIYNASDTDVYFSRAGNKQSLTFGSGNITDMNLIFPDMSGNFVLLLKQDGTGSRTVTNWKTFDQDAGNESTVKWAGGSAPTLTTTASKTDILSFYWDNANHVAYGVATLNF